MDIREIAEFWNSVDEGIDAEAKDGALYAAGKKEELADVRFGKKNGKDVFQGAYPRCQRRAVLKDQRQLLSAHRHQ